MEANDGDRGAPTERTVARYARLAEGQWGVVCVESAAVTLEAVSAANGLALTAEAVGAFRRLVDTFRSVNPDIILLVQISHGGSKSLGVAAKKSVWSTDSRTPVFTGTELDRIVDDHVTAAVLAEAAGFDGIDFKLGHGYVASQLLRPSNQRPDRWGGSFENRTRFIHDAYGAIRQAVTRPDFIVGSRVSLFERLPGGIGSGAGPVEPEDLSEPLELVARLVELKADFFNVTAGDPAVTTDLSIPTRKYRQTAFEHFRYTEAVKSRASTASVIGSAYSVLGREAFGVAELNIEAGKVDLVGFGRASLADPALPAHLRNGDPVVECTACNGCGQLIESGLPSRCVSHSE